MSGDQDHRTEHYNFIFHDEPSPFFSHKPSSGAPGGGAYYDVPDALLGAAPSTTSFLSITDLLRSSMVDYTAAAAAASAFGLSSFPSEPPAAVGTVGSELMLDANTLSAGNIPPPPTTTTLGCGGGAATPLTPNSSSSSSSTEAGAGEEEQLKQDQEEVKQQPEEAETEGDMSKKLDKPKKKGEKRARDPSFAFVTQSEVDHLEDGYRWRKYGQKAVKNSPYPRSYYRCTTQKCPVKKRVERCYQNPLIVITTYEGRHTHHCPATLRGSGYLLPPPPPMPQVMPASFCHDLMMQQVLQRLDDDDKFSRRDGSLNPSVILQNLPPSLQHLPFQDYGFFHG